MSTASDGIVERDAVGLSRSIAAREVSCAEVMAAFLDRIGRLNTSLNAIVSLRPADELMAEARARDDELARTGPRGPLHGFPLAVKDLVAVGGLPNTMGSRIHARSIPDADAIMVERLRASGAIIVGKTNVPEFGLGSQTFNEVFGATRNAYDPGRTSGGSSGGAAVAVATGMLPVADGTDHGGSLRNPAAWNNIFGLRTSAGRVPGGTDEVFLPPLTVAGPMARNVPDLALLLSVQAGYDPRVPTSLGDDAAVFARPLKSGIEGWRIGWMGDLGGELPLEPGILELCEAGCRVLEGLGATVEEARPDAPLEEMFQNWIKLRAWAFAAARARDYADPATRALMKPEARWEAERGQALSALEVAEAAGVRSRWYASVRRLFERFDVLVLPGAQVFPFAIDTPWPREIAGRAMDTYHRWMEVMIPFTMADCPTVSVPVGFGPGGLPMGMQIAGPSRGELRVLRVAQSYDEATGWARRHPPPGFRAEAEAASAHIGESRHPA